MTWRLFKRNIRLTLARPLDFHNPEPNGLIVTDLGVRFHIVRNLRSEPDTCEITVSNLNEEARSRLQKNPTFVRFEVGYSEDYQRLFTGDIIAGSVRSHKTDTTWESSFKVMDGGRAFRFARIDRSFKGGVTAYQALQAAAETFGVKLRASAAVQKEMRAQYASGLTLSGQTATTIDGILSKFGFSWSIEGGTLHVLRPDEVRTDTTEVTISQATGLIGSPEFSDPPKKGQKPILIFRSLIYPELLPGGRVRVESLTANGTFKIHRVAHTGDTHSDDWTSEVECRSL